MNKHDIIKTLQSGICELWYTDSHSVEHSMIATLSQTHLPHDCDTMDILNDQNTIVAFNVNTENWQTFSAHSVIDIEQLTGEGAPNNENKLQASSEYLQQLELFTEQEFDELEHPEDSTVEGSD